MRRRDTIWRVAPALAFCLLLSAYHSIFSPFLAHDVRLASDYGLGLPFLLAGYIWYRAVGPWQVPWFTPAFCGGEPFFADPQSGYYAAPQLFTLLVDPLRAAYLTMLSFAGLGYLGMYFLLRRAFSVTRSAAIFGATVFMFNGFYAFRMLAGHLGYHGFMLIPWMAAVLLIPRPTRLPPWLAELWLGVVAGLIAAYWIQCGLGTLLVPVGLSLILVGALRARLSAPAWFRACALRSLLGLIVSAALSIAKVTAGLTFLGHFGRAQYLLPGFTSVGDTLHFMFTSVFISPADIVERSVATMSNVEWLVDRPELEYGITWAPLIVIVAAAGFAGVRARARRSAPTRPESHSSNSAARNALGLLVMLVILAIPVAINTYAPGWNALLKRTPLLMSASTLVRWFCLYIPFLAVLAALSLSSMPATLARIVAVLGCALIPVLNAAQDRSGLSLSSYDPGRITAGYEAIASGRLVPKIDGINVTATANHKIVLPVDRNDALVDNRSQLACYNPIFGYRLENFPTRGLRPGSVRSVTDGYFNLKNPACYVFPDENHCTPGEHFRSEQSALMERFVHYQPFAFEMSHAQRRASLVTLSTLGLIALLVIATAAWLGASVIRGKLRARRDSNPRPSVPKTDALSS